MTSLIRPTTMILVGEEVTGHLALLETVEQCGNEPPCHRHHWEDEIVYVLEGEIAFLIDSTWRIAHEGNSMVVPRGIEHTFVVLSAKARLLTMFVPAGFEGFYRELGEVTPWAQGDAQALERCVALAARYGCEITGPHPGRPFPLALDEEEAP